jgi:predicted enzyme involved in methoxymalonyl-ACP biosynthesis
VDFVLSCRVMGRRIELAMLHVANEWARAHDADRLLARYIKTAKNAPCHDILTSSPLERNEAATEFTWTPSSPLDAPAAVQVEWIGAPERVAQRS